MTTFQWLTCEKTPFLDFTMQGQMVKNTPKRGQWLEPIGSVWSSPPWDKNLYIMNSNAPYVPDSISSLYLILFQAANH